MDVAVVILNWNGKKFLEKFLPNVIRYSSNDADIIVADNASTDDSIEYLKINFPQIKIIENKQNGGFAKGYNDALKKVETKYYILLNSDIEVTENWINPVISLMEREINIAACQPKIRSYSDKEKFEYAGAAGGFIDSYGYPFCRGRIFSDIETDLNQYNNNFEIFWATGACMFVKADLFHKLNGFDEDFFAHMEEIDFCWRLKNLGFKIMYCAESKVFHVGGGTLPKSSSRKTYLNFRNNFTLLLKNLPSNQVFKVFAIRLFLDALAGLKFLFEGHFKDFIAVIRAHFSFYRTFRHNLNKRKKLKQLNVSSIYRGNIVVDYYLKRKKSFSNLNYKKFTK